MLEIGEGIDSGRGYDCCLAFGSALFAIASIRFQGQHGAVRIEQYLCVYVDDSNRFGNYIRER